MAFRDIASSGLFEREGSGYGKIRKGAGLIGSS
jgi:hypothetical protein